MQKLILKIQPTDVYRICIYQTKSGFYTVNSQTKKGKGWKKQRATKFFPDDYQGAISAIKMAGFILMQHLDKN